MDRIFLLLPEVARVNLENSAWSLATIRDSSLSNLGCSARKYSRATSASEK